MESVSEQKTRRTVEVEKVRLAKSKHTTVYDDYMTNRLTNGVTKELACAILQSALEDADYEFLSDDYDTWKKYRLQRKKRCEVVSELKLKEEYEDSKHYKEFLFDLANVPYLGIESIPQSIKDERSMFEDNCMKNLVKITNYNETTLFNISNLHGWKIGVNYEEPTIFDL